MQHNQKYASGQLKAAYYEVLHIVYGIEGGIKVSDCKHGWHMQL